VPSFPADVLRRGSSFTERARHENAWPMQGMLKTVATGTDPPMGIPAGTEDYVYPCITGGVETFDLALRSGSLLISAGSCKEVDEAGQYGGAHQGKDDHMLDFGELLSEEKELVAEEIAGASPNQHGKNG